MGTSKRDYETGYIFRTLPIRKLGACDGFFLGLSLWYRRLLILGFGEPRNQESGVIFMLGEREYYQLLPSSNYEP